MPGAWDHWGDSRHDQAYQAAKERVIAVVVIGGNLAVLALAAARWAGWWPY